VFDGRVYIYGSHDRFNGHGYCLNDYITYSASVDDLTNWTYEGVIYEKTTDPLNTEGAACLYAPDVTVGPDGRYYLYYVLDKFPIVSVAVAMKKLNITDIDVIQTVGPYEINPAVFIDEWIAFLAKTKGDDAYKLLMEAYRMYKTADYIEDNLADYGQTHPLLFLDVLSKKLSLEFMDAEFDASALKTRIQELSGKQLEEIKNIVKLAESLIPKDLTIGAEMMEVGFEISVRENIETKAT